MYNASAPWYYLAITLNGKEVTQTKFKFTYYYDPSIKSITPALGPLRGGTLSKLHGEGFG